LLSLGMLLLGTQAGAAGTCDGKTAVECKQAKKECKWSVKAKSCQAKATKASKSTKAAVKKEKAPAAAPTEEMDEGAPADEAAPEEGDATEY